MSKRSVVILLVLAMALGLAWWSFHREKLPSKPPATFTANATPFQISAPAPTPVASTSPQGRPPASAPRSHILDVYPRWSGGRAITTDDPRWQVWKERQRNDPLWKGKMAIEFYGKVVDQHDQPVPDAAVKFTWTDLSREGTSHSQTKTDSNGRFELRSAKGKSLGVEVAKDGYERSLAQNQYGFEYASFDDEEYHEPDRNNPVLFYLRKKGDAEALRYREQEIKVSVGHPLTIPIDGSTQLQFILNSNVHPKKGKWEAELAIENGGIVPARDEFIVEAPLTGYQPKLTIGPETPKPPTWQLYQGGSFYMKLRENYGRVDIEMIPGNDWFRLKTWINPNPGSRNLEYDPSKQTSAR